MLEFLTDWPKDDPKWLVLGILMGLLIMWWYRDSVDFTKKADIWDNFYLSRFLLGAFVTLLFGIVLIWKLVEAIF